ncbi:MAG: SH3 domain-containing protein [Gammaproteobacteria bacterium]
MTRILKLSLTFLLCITSNLAAAAETAVTIRPVELKQKPFTDAPSLATLPEKTPVTILERQGAWTHVQSAPQTQGWVRMLSLRLGDGTVKQGDLGLASVLNAARTGSSGVTVTTGVRGLSEEELRDAQPDPAELEKVERMAVAPQEARQFAADAKLKAAPLAYLPAPAGSGKSSASTSTDSFFGDL